MNHCTEYQYTRSLRMYNEEMVTSCSFPAPLLGYLSGVICIGTIVICYVLAASLKHVHPWLPMISACAVYFPEMFVFRLGLVLSAAGFTAQMVVVYCNNRADCKNRTALTFGIFASVNAMLVGVVNEHEWRMMHGVVAGLFFSSSFLYTTIFAISSCNDKRISLVSRTVKQICLLVSLAVIVVAGILSAFSFHKYRPYVALCEWTGVFTFCIFQMMMGHDLSGVTVGSVKKERKEFNPAIYELDMNQGSGLSEKTPLVSILSAK